MIRNSVIDDARDVMHVNMHMEKLSGLYDNVHVKYAGSTIPFYSSGFVNDIADDAEFNIQNVGVYCAFHCLSPYRTTYIECDLCDGAIKVHSEPFSIPIFVVPESARYATDYEAQFIVTSYEDVLRRLKMPQPVFGKCKEYILEQIKECEKTKTKVDLQFLNDATKNLLVFA